MPDAKQDELMVAGSDDGVGNSVGVLTRLPDSQVFARDPEQYGDAEMTDTIERLSKILVRMRKARQDDALVKEAAAKLKKTNAAAKKAKAKKAGKVPADPMGEVI